MQFDDEVYYLVLVEVVFEKEDYEVVEKVYEVVLDLVFDNSEVWFDFVWFLVEMFCFEEVLLLLEEVCEVV